jgi:hypothetical protein
VCERAQAASRQQCLFCGRQLGTIVTARKQVAVSIQGHHNRCMAEPCIETGFAMATFSSLVCGYV